MRALRPETLSPAIYLLIRLEEHILCYVFSQRPVIYFPFAHVFPFVIVYLCVY